GGPDFRPDLFGAAVAGCGYDVGDGDEVHGETGDDTVYGGCGDDALYGDAGDDDLVGGWGNDWISGGTGQDGVLGDDGRIFTSRNGLTEPLYGLTTATVQDEISTPGNAQVATINVTGALKKTVDITPFNLTPNEGGTRADDPLFRPLHADDIVFGGLGDDFLHGGSGDDAISGAEALAEAYGQLYDASGALAGIVRIDFTRPHNPGNALTFGADGDSWQDDRLGRTGEFALYDEFDPRRKLLLEDDGRAAKDGTGVEFFLNWLRTDGPAVASSTYGTVNTDGADVVFGDLGNDWLVGGTGKDTLWGGWGNDLMNADDDLETNGGLNDAPDTHPSYEDRAFGGAGLDILIGNTGGDRLIDWVGEFNSFIVPFAPFGLMTVSRQVPPGLYAFLYALSASQGADPTRATDTGNEAERNGEPDGELGLITQSDRELWGDQTGGPTDPQPGNVPGGRRDVLRSADFNDGSTQAFLADSGSWTSSGGALRVTAESLGADAAAVFYHDEYLPIYYELAAQVAIDKSLAGWEGNAYVIFDYFSPTDFKFAGINHKTNKLEMGHRTAGGWVTDVQSNLKVWQNRYYSLLVAVNGTAVTVIVDGKTAFTHVFDPRVIDGEAYGLNKGMVGVGSNNSRGYYDNVKVQVLPPKVTLDYTETFDGGEGAFTGPASGDWGVTGGRIDGTASAGTAAYKQIDLGIGRGLSSDAWLEVTATLRSGGSGGVVFDQYAADDYKFVALDVQTGAVVLGHHDPRRGRIVDVSVARVLAPSTDYVVLLTLKGASASVVVNGSYAVSWGYNAAVVDGGFGLLSLAGTTSFDQVRVRTNDRAFTLVDGQPATLSGTQSSETISASSETTISSGSESTTISSGSGKKTKG
ncbi:MAG: calcium-binding protein, partial [Gaiellaceae bacterium]